MNHMLEDEFGRTTPYDDYPKWVCDDEDYSDCESDDDFDESAEYIEDGCS